MTLKRQSPTTVHEIMTGTLRNLPLKILRFRENGQNCFGYQLIFSSQKQWYFKYLPMTKKIFDFFVSGSYIYIHILLKKSCSVFPISVRINNDVDN